MSIRYPGTCNLKGGSHGTIIFIVWTKCLPQCSPSQTTTYGTEPPSCKRTGCATRHTSCNCPSHRYNATAESSQEAS